MRVAGKSHCQGHLPALAVVNANLATFEVDVLDTEPRAFEDSKARAVQQAGHQQRYAAELGEQAGYLARREHDRCEAREIVCHVCLPPSKWRPVPPLRHRACAAAVADGAMGHDRVVGTASWGRALLRRGAHAEGV